MSLDNLKIDADVVNEQERMPSGSDGSWLLDSGVYPMVIDVAFYTTADSGAVALNVHYKSVEFSKYVREKYWVLSGNAKGNKNYYIDSEGKKHLLPDMQRANELANLVTGKDLGDLETDDRVLNLWSYDAKAEVPTKVKVLPDLLGVTVQAGVLKIVDNKRTQNGAGEWVATNEKKETNEVSKIFTEDGFTLAERNAKETETKYLDAWKAKHEGNDVNRFKPQQNAPTPVNLNSSSDDEPLFS